MAPIRACEILTTWYLPVQRGPEWQARQGLSAAAYQQAFDQLVQS
ncbi:hypothetical protein [Rhodococcus opacus]